MHFGILFFVVLSLVNPICFNTFTHQTWCCEGGWGLWVWRFRLVFEAAYADGGVGEAVEGNMHTCQLEESEGTWAHGWQHIHNNSHHSHPICPPSSSPFSSHLLPLLSAPSSLNDNPTLEILTLYNPTIVALRLHWLKGALLVPANLPFHCLKHCLFDRTTHIDVA